MTVNNSYNQLALLPEMPYNIISYLLNNNELIWKLLKYDDANAWKDDAEHPSLTKVEKGLLIYDGIKEETDCRVFLDVGMDDAWTQQATILRVSVLDVIPTNYVVGYVTISVEVYSHYLLNTLSSYQPRDLAIIQSVVETINGAEVGGLGRLYFDYSKNPRSKIMTIGNSPFKGKACLLCNWMV